MDTTFDTGDVSLAALDTGDCPPEVSPALWDILTSIKLDTAATSGRLATLEKRVTSLESSRPTKASKQVMDDLDHMKKSMAVIEARLDRSENITLLHGNQIDDQRAYSMKNNLIFTFDRTSEPYKEFQGENCIAKIRHFLSSVLGIHDVDKFFIPVAHRIGQISKDRIRPILAKFPIAMELDTILNNAKRLKNTKHFINRQTTPKTREREQFVQSQLKAMKSKDSSIKAKVSKGRLIVNGQVQTKYLPPSLPEDCTNVTNPPLPSDIIHDSGNHFTGYAVPASTLKEVSGVMRSLRQQPNIAGASHIVYAYIINNDAGDVLLQNYDSDGDWGSGLELLRHMSTEGYKNTLCVSIRRMSVKRSHIGRRRKDHVLSTCSQAYSNIK